MSYYLTYALLRTYALLSVLFAAVFVLVLLTDYIDRWRKGLSLGFLAVVFTWTLIKVLNANVRKAMDKTAKAKIGEFPEEIK